MGRKKGSSPVLIKKNLFQNYFLKGNFVVPEIVVQTGYDKSVVYNYRREYLETVSNNDDIITREREANKQLELELEQHILEKLRFKEKLEKYSTTKKGKPNFVILAYMDKVEDSMMKAKMSLAAVKSRPILEDRIEMTILQRLTKGEQNLEKHYDKIKEILDNKSEEQSKKD